jgi:Carboxypeptidase regulatory-like domain
MKHLAILIVIVGSLAYSQTKVHLNGEIKGSVTDQNGNPISGATVYAVPQGLTLNDITPRSVKTDGNGEFDFRGGFELEEYKLYSRKDEDAHFDPFDGFYADSKAKASAVDLTQDHPSATVTVKMGEKAGVVVGRVIDADTGAVLKARLYFYDGQGHGHQFDSAVDGKYRAFLPPGKDISLMVTVLSASSARTQIPVAPLLRLEQGQFIYMDIPVSKQ